MQLFSINEEFLVSTISSECADYVPVLCTHRPSLLPIECFSEIYGLVLSSGSHGPSDLYRKVAQTGSFRGSKSRNKVFVGEPAYGSLPFAVAFEHTLLQTRSVRCYFIFLRGVTSVDCVANFMHNHSVSRLRSMREERRRIVSSYSGECTLFNLSIIHTHTYDVRCCLS